MTQKGFTLLEVLMALLVFSLVSIMSYQAINGLVQAEQRTQEATAALSELERAMLFWQRDVQQIVPRAISNEIGESVPALILPEDALVEFSSGGYYDWSGRFFHNIQRVRYVWENKMLVRETWPLLDRTNLTEPQRVILLHDVISAQVMLEPEYDVAKNKTVEENTDILARTNAISLTLEHQRFGKVTRILLLRMPSSLY